MPDDTRTQLPDPDATITGGSPTRAGHGGTAVPGYAILETLGEGGMGVVFKATHIRLNRTVALKMILGGGLGKERLRFLAEAEAIAAIDHPNVVRIFDTGEADGRPFIAMEHLAGGSLAERLASGGRKPPGSISDTATLSLDATSKENRGAHAPRSPMQPRAAAELVCKLALAVQAAHDRQIVHRDLKPANILFDAAGEPRVTDFGLAKKEGGSDLTGTNAIMGTPAYMAPEQAKGGTKFVGPAADVWALGVILYECLSGARPFTGANEIEVIRNVVEAEPSSIRSHSRDLPRDLELIAQKCLMKDPADRYASAAALAEDLNNWLTNKPVSVKAAGPVERTFKWVRRNRLAAAIMASAFIGLLAMTGLAWYAYVKAQEIEAANVQLVQSQEAESQALRRAVENEAKAKLAAENLRTETHQQRRLLDVLRIREAETLFEHQRLGLARDLLGEVAPENRTIAWRLARRRFEGSDCTLYGHTGAVQGVAWSPDGRTLATAGADRAVRLWDAATGESLQTLTGHEKAATCVAWSSDGRMLASGSSDGTVRLWNATDGYTSRVLKGHTDAVQCVAWSPDGRTLASGGLDRTILLWDPDRGEPRRTVKVKNGAVWTLTWHPDGKTLAAAGTAKTIGVWSAASGALVREWDSDASVVRSLGWSPDGTQLASSSDRRTVLVWDPATGKSIRGLGEDDVDVSHIAWSPDGLLLAVGSVAGGFRIISPNGPRVDIKFQGHVRSVNQIAWHPDGHRFATVGQDKTLRFWDLPDGQHHCELQSDGGVRNFAWSPDSRAFAAVTDVKKISIFNAATGRVIRTMSENADGVIGIAWSPDGHTLATFSIDDSVRLWDAATGAFRGEIQKQPAGAYGLAWSPDSKLLAVASEQGLIRLRDGKSGAGIRELKASTEIVRGLAWSPDGAVFAAAGDDGVIRLWNAESWELIRELRGHAAGVLGLAWHSNSRLLASAGGDHAVRIWDRDTGQILSELKGHVQEVMSVSWHRDGRTLVSSSADGSVRLWDATTGQTTLELSRSQGIERAAWSPDGRMLAAPNGEHDMRLWREPPPAAAEVFCRHGEFMTAMAWSPDRKRLATTGNDAKVCVWDAASGAIQREFQLRERADQVYWSRDGRQIVAVSRVTDRGQTRLSEHAWDAETGREIAGNVMPPKAETGSPSDDGVFYLFVDRSVLKVNRAIAPEELARRRQAAAPRPSHHFEFANHAEETGQWEAAVFHLRRLIAFDPGNNDVKARLAAAEQNLRPREIAPMPKLSGR